MVWAPIRTQDNKRAAENASAYLPDARAEHFWDLWSYMVKVYTEQLKFPNDAIAWDIFLVYKPHLSWRDRPPEPTAWFQNLNIEHGSKYSRQLLKAELEKWVR